MVNLRKFRVVGLNQQNKLKIEVQKFSTGKKKGILFKSKREFSNQKNIQQFCRTFMKLNVSLEYVFYI